MNLINLDTFKQIAELFAQQSPCCKKKVGAIIVDNNGNIVASGFNKSIGNLCENHFKEQYSNLTKDKYPGYELFQKRFDEWMIVGEGRELHREWSKRNEIHAEQMCIKNWKKNQLESATMIVTLEPCIECAKAIILCGGINSVYYLNKFEKNSGADILIQKGITVHYIGEKNG